MLICAASLLALALSNTQPATQPAERIPIPHRLSFVVHAYACFSPDGSTIVYQSNASGNWDLYTMKSDGTGVRPIVQSPAADITPVFSPDGNSIALLSEHYR